MNIRILVPELKPALPLQLMYAYAQKNKIEIQRFDFLSEQGVFDWIASFSRMNQKELYDEIVKFGENNHV